MKDEQIIPSESLTVFLVLMGLLFFISPITKAMGIGNIFFKGIFCALSISCIYLVSRKISQTLIALVLVLPGIGISFSLDSFEFTPWEIINLLLNLFLYTFIVYVIARYVKNHKKVDRHILSGAVCIYLLLGLVWSFIYMLIELSHPNSFSGIYENNVVKQNSISETFNHLFYYSYVTLTTLGYGSIAPRTIIASAFASAEAIVGQLYIAIIIARLVSLYTAQERQEISE